MFLRILFIAILNLCSGYCLAWYLHGPRGMFAWPMPAWLRGWTGRISRRNFAPNGLPLRCQARLRSAP